MALIETPAERFSAILDELDAWDRDCRDNNAKFMREIEASRAAFEKAMA